MISKELFISAINSIMNQKDYQNEKNKLYKKFGADGYLIEPNNDDIVVCLLKECFKPCDELECINVFCYDHNFGRGKGNQEYVDSHGQKIKIADVNDLYDYLLTKVYGEE